MEFFDLSYIPANAITEFTPDLFITASGYESRSINVAQKFQNPGKKRIAFAFSECLNDIDRPENDLFFRKFNYNLLPFSGDEEPDYESLLQEFQGDQLKILIDISVMTRLWYHTFIKYLYCTEDFKQLIIRVVYSPALFNESITLRKRIKLLDFQLQENFKAAQSPNKKRALLLGLGIEKGLSKVIHDLVDPDLTLLFYADPSVQQEYIDHVLINNHCLIKDISIRDLIPYPLENPEKLFKILNDKVLPLREDYNVIIVPQGPKIFSFTAMLLQINYPDIEIKYPKFQIKQIRDRKPLADLIGMDLHFTSE
jgi:hypothetical protein